MKYKVQLLNKEEVAAGTMAFYFSKPEGFTYKSGQSIDLHLINPAETDAEGNMRSFSLITTPDEDRIGIATRMRDTAFKRTLKNMPEKTELELEGPFGDMTLHNDTAKPAVILAGGIGITPFYSMAQYAAEQSLPHRIYLFYSNRRPEDAAFLHRLQDLEKKNANFHLIATMTEMEKSLQPWSGQTGYITKELVAEKVSDFSNAIAYTAGPPAMTKAMHDLLNQAGMNDDYIRMEEFAGY